MKLSRSLLLVPVVSLLVAGAVGAGACTVSAAGVAPLTTMPLPTTITLPSGLPLACTGDVYYVGPSSLLCPSEPTYYVCGGSTYDQYACTNPGTGWTLETTAPDPASSLTAGSSSAFTTEQVPDAGEGDASDEDAHDATVRDATVHDAAEDATRDAARDAGKDAERDAPGDAEKDATRDAARDGGKDARGDATRDAERDAEKDAHRG